MKYHCETRTRYQEGASFEDIVNGDAYETAYIVYDEEGGILWDTTNYENVREYFEYDCEHSDDSDIRYDAEIVFERFGWDVDCEHHPVYCYFGEQKVILETASSCIQNIRCDAKLFAEKIIACEDSFELKLKEIKIIEHKEVI